jgi:T-complex protein 1 subunit zeta
VDAVLAIRTPDKPVDLHMVELMEMQHKTATETALVKGNAALVTTKFIKILS